MTRLAFALLGATLVAGLAPLPSAVADPNDIAVLGPSDGGEGAWSSERMRGARERLKDLLPGHR